MGRQEGEGYWARRSGTATGYGTLGCMVGAGQFVAAGYALAQFAAAYSLLTQMGIYVYEGHGKLVCSPAQLLGMGS